MSESGSGKDIWGSSDQFRYVYRSLSGDGDIAATPVQSQSNSSSWAKAGVMFRTTIAADSAYYFAFVTPGHGINVQYRGSAGAKSQQQAAIVGSAPISLRVVRAGNTYTAYASNDGGFTYSIVPNSTVTLSLGSSVLEGFAVTSHSATVASTAVVTSHLISAPVTSPTPTPPPPSATNLLINPSFESATLAPWSSWQGTLTRAASSVAPNGSYVARVDEASATQCTCYSLEYDPAVTSTVIGSNYTSSVFLAAATASAVGKPVVLVVREKNSAGGTVAQSSTSPLTLSSTFQKLALTMAAEATGDTLDVYVMQNKSTVGDAFFADMLTLSPESATAPSSTPSATPTPIPSITSTVTPSPTATATPAPIPAIGNKVNMTPTGPPAPNGGWSVAYADGFNLPIKGTPQAAGAASVDNTFYPSRGGFNNNNPCIDAPRMNSNEMEVFNCNKVSVDSQGLELGCTYLANTMPEYRCGIVSGSSAAGYKTFSWTPGHGETWAFECVCKFPYNTGEADPGWWASDPPWTDEFDFFESWGWTGQVNAGYTTTGTGTVWVYSTSPFQTIEGAKVYPFDPSGAFHRYTTILYPNNTFSEFVDGQLQTGGWSFGNGVLGPPPSFKSVSMRLILSYALRMDSAGTNPSAGFTSGTRNFTVRSVAVYEDSAHAGQNISNGGIAPGTTVG